MPVFFASEVAALIGRNKYKTKDEAIFRVLSTISKFKPLIERLKSETGGKTQKEVVDAIPEDVKVALDSAVSTAISVSSEVEIVKTIDTFKKDTAKILLTNAIEGKSSTVEFKAAAERIQKKESTVEQEMKTLEKSTVMSVISSEVQKRRGTQMESKVEDDHAVTTGKEITNRNSSLRIELPEYTLFGYIDGMQDGRIVETKNRKRIWTEPPAYDIIQLRCYMKMKGEVDGLLLERFPNGNIRETLLSWDPMEWSYIHSGLCEVAEEISKMTDKQVEKIARSVLIK
jgi:hypothetical protein